MKKVLFFLIFTSIFGFVDAQFYHPYLQLESGIAVTDKSTGMICVEYGTNYKWLDLAVALDFESNSFFKEYTGEVNIFKNNGYDPARTHNDEFSYFTNTSLQFVAKVNIIRLFTDNSRHAFKLSGGYGLIRYQKSWSSSDFSESSAIAYNLTTQCYYGLLGSFKASYEYRITPKFSVGAFFGGTYYPALGLLIKTNI